MLTLKPVIPTAAKPGSPAHAVFVRWGGEAQRRDLLFSFISLREFRLTSQASEAAEDVLSGKGHGFSRPVKTQNPGFRGCGKCAFGEGARLQPCRKGRRINTALAAEGWVFSLIGTFSTFVFALYFRPPAASPCYRSTWVCPRCPRSFPVFGQHICCREKLMATESVQPRLNTASRPVAPLRRTPRAVRRALCLERQKKLACNFPPPRKIETERKQKARPSSGRAFAFTVNSHGILCVAARITKQRR